MNLTVPEPLETTSDLEHEYVINVYLRKQIDKQNKCTT